MTDHFASSTVSVILSWLAVVPVVLALFGYILSLFRKHEGIPWLFSTWVGVCFLVLSPARYMFFQLVTAISYPFQSFFALTSLFWLAILTPFAFCFLYAVGIGLPLFLVMLMLGNRPRWWRYVLASATAPLVATIGTLVFSFALPFAALSTHWLRAEDVIKATDGPAYFAFAFVPQGLVALPPYSPKTPATTKDYLRSHVALIYLGKSEHDFFLHEAYPELYDEFAETLKNRGSTPVTAAVRR